MAWWSKSITDVDRLFDLYQRGDKNVYAVFSKERARDGYMRYPAVLWSRRKRGFVCPDCLELIEMETSSDGTRYMVPSDQFFLPEGASGEPPMSSLRHTALGAGQ